MELSKLRDAVHWQSALAQYRTVIEAKTSKSRKRDEIRQLDQWYQEELPRSVQQRSPMHLTLPDLVKLMEWKLARGKFRPRLGQLVKENEDDRVVRVTTEAFQLASGEGNLKEAISRLTELKAVGPATASAILCTGVPEIAPFLADESAACMFQDLGKVQYTLSYYLSYARLLVEKAEELNKTDDSKSDWTAHSVELALWTVHTAEKIGVPLKISDDEKVRKRMERKLCLTNEEDEKETVTKNK